ncbi:MAG: hypothetical protein K0Q75_1711 [Anaerospora sp.]|nr:hypothetical protein [Anaerospora sp.]
MKVLIVYYSMYGHVHQMAEAAGSPKHCLWKFLKKWEQLKHRKPLLTSLFAQ